MTQKRPLLLIPALITLVLTGAALSQARKTTQGSANPPATPLNIGTYLTPTGTQTEVGGYPSNLVVSPDGKFVIVTNLGARSRVAVLDINDGHKVSEVLFDAPIPASRDRDGIFYGLAFGPTVSGITPLYASQGSQDKVTVLNLAADGTLTRTDKSISVPTDRTTTGGNGQESPSPLVIAGIALNADGTTLYTTANTFSVDDDFGSRISVVDMGSGNVVDKITVPGYPFAVAPLTTGKSAGKKLYVSSEQKGVVAVVDLEAKREVKEIEAGSNASNLLLSRDQSRLYVAGSGSDLVTVVDTAKDEIVRTILLRPAEVRGLPSATPLGMCLSPDEKTLYVALADLNAVAFVDVKKGDVKGYIPVGWYPNAVAVSPDGKRLFVSNAKGVAVRNPNNMPKPGITDRPQYVENIIEGTVTTVTLADAEKDMGKLSAQVIENNRITRDLVKTAQKALKNPGIEHVIYIIKENRTYDQVLGDIEGGNGDKSLALFGRDITPNQHALAERFVLLDNFYCCAEVSGDGWNWSTQGMANEYNSRNVVYGYTGKARAYDYEGTNTGLPVDILGVKDVATAPGGYIWDKVADKKLGLRNYGFFTDDVNLPRDSAEVGTQGLANAPVKKALVGKTSENFRQYDTDYADSEAWVKHGLEAAPKQLKQFGKFNDPARFTAWKREFDEYVAKKNMPRFSMVRFGRDHTAGTSPGNYSPRAMVADNDYAVGQLVEAVSRSPYWNKTAIFVVEDDAQAGYDHVDAHRSIAFVISPFVRKATRDSRFYNTDSMLHTMENILGLSPMNLYDATAPTLNVFADKPENNEPYTAILPDKAIVGEINKPTAYRAQDSARLVGRFREESAADEQLNDILWHNAKGVNVPAPARVYSVRPTALPRPKATARRKDADD